MITLQADPLIQWDESITDINNQSQDAQKWLRENVLSVIPTTNTETLVREGKPDLVRFTDLTYSALGFQVVITRIYRNNTSCLVNSSSYVLTEI